MRAASALPLSAFFPTAIATRSAFVMPLRSSTWTSEPSSRSAAFTEIQDELQTIAESSIC
jgi:hypothetical protein